MFFILLIYLMHLLFNTLLWYFNTFFLFLFYLLFITLTTWIFELLKITKGGKEWSIKKPQFSPPGKGALACAWAPANQRKNSLKNSWTVSKRRSLVFVLITSESTDTFPCRPFFGTTHLETKNSSLLITITAFSPNRNISV